MRPEHWLYTIPLRLQSLFRWAQADQELDDELRDHLERKTEEYVAQGMTQEEAWRRARLDLGGVEKVKEECRDARQVNYIQNFMQDFRFAVRALRRSPILSAAAIFSLGVAIGAKDRKSTRLNSSHGYISYAVFCLKKKTNRVCPHDGRRDALYVGLDPRSEHLHHRLDRPRHDTSAAHSATHCAAAPTLAVPAQVWR